VSECGGILLYGHVYQLYAWHILCSGNCLKMQPCGYAICETNTGILAKYTDLTSIFESRVQNENTYTWTVDMARWIEKST
jgi:hypothetical protein